MELRDAITVNYVASTQQMLAETTRVYKHRYWTDGGWHSTRYHTHVQVDCHCQIPLPMSISVRTIISPPLNVFTQTLSWIGLMIPECFSYSSSRCHAHRFGSIKYPSVSKLGPLRVPTTSNSTLFYTQRTSPTSFSCPASEKAQRIELSLLPS